MSEIDSWSYWLTQLENRSASTRRNYKVYVQNFLEYAKLTPNQAIEKQRESLEKKGADPRLNHVVETLVKSWLIELRKNRTPGTCRTAFASVKSFFALNMFPLRLGREASIPGDAEYASRIPEKNEVIQILDASKWKYRAAIMVLKDSGLRVSDLVRLRWEDKVDMGDGFWSFSLVTQKRKVAAVSFIGPESTRLLNQFKTQVGRIFKTTPTAMSIKLCRIIHSIGIQGVTAHGLRKYFQTSMQHARVPTDYYLRMMGKTTSVYSETRRSELFEAYKKAYPELSIYQVKEQAEEVEALKKQMLSLLQTVEELKTELAKK